MIRVASQSTRCSMLRSVSGSGSGLTAPTRSFDSASSSLIEEPHRCDAKLRRLAAEPYCTVEIIHQLRDIG
jgi:hypothetical protein